MKSQGPKTFTLKTKSGEKTQIPWSPEESDIDLFLHEIMEKRELAIFMDLVLEKNDLLRTFTNHRIFFCSKNFEHRAVLGRRSSREINPKALQTIKKSYEVKFRNELSPHLDQLVKFFTLIGAIGIKTVVQGLNDKQIQRLRRTPLKDIVEALKKEEIKLSLGEGDKRALKKESEKIFVKNIDMYMMSSLFPLVTVELIEGQKGSDPEEGVFSEIERTGIGFPIFSVYICDNVEAHDYGNPPFVAVLFPSMRTPETIKCPNCRQQTKTVKYFSFIPEVSKRIMSGGGFYPYIVAYRMHGEGINFVSNVVTSGTNETDFLIYGENAQFYAEIKCFKRESTDPGTPSSSDRIASNLISAHGQMCANLKKWADSRNVQFDKKFILTNYTHEDIAQAVRENDNLKRRVAGEEKVLGYDQLDTFIKEIKGE